jgi:hypothetical protein
MGIASLNPSYSNGIVGWVERSVTRQANRGAFARHLRAADRSCNFAKFGV